MNYLIEQKAKAVKPEFSVRDERENEVYRVEGVIFRLPERLWIRDLEGSEVALIEQTGALRTKFEITHDGALLAAMKPKRNWFKMNYVLTETATGAETIARGNLAASEYDFQRNAASVATVRKNRTRTDSYALEVADGENDLVFIAAVLVIDAHQAELERRRNRN